MLSYNEKVGNSRELSIQYIERSKNYLYEIIKYKTWNFL